MKRKIAILLLAALAATVPFALAGCTDGPSAGQTVLSVLNFRPEDQDFYEWMVEEFQRENPDIYVEYEAVDTNNFSSLLTTRFQAEQVDVYGIQPGASLSSATSLARSEPLNDLNIWEDISEAAVKEITFDGNRLIAPLTYATNVVFYKKDYFTENGLSVPTTWTDFLRVLDFMKADRSVKAPIVYGGKDQWPIAMAAAQLEATVVRPHYENVVRSIVDDHYKFATDPYGREMFEKLNTLVAYFQKDCLGMEYAQAPGKFASDAYPLMIDGSWSLAAIREANPTLEIGAFLLPGSDNAADNVKYPAKVASGWSISPKSKAVEAGKKFIEFQFRKDVYTKYCNDLRQGPAAQGIELTDTLAKEMALVPTVLTLDNMWVPKMRYDVTVKQEVGPGFVRKDLSVSDALAKLDKVIADDATIWQSEVANWKKRFPLA